MANCQLTLLAIFAGSPFQMSCTALIVTFVVVTAFSTRQVFGLAVIVAACFLYFYLGRGLTTIIDGRRQELGRRRQAPMRRPMFADTHSTFLSRHRSEIIKTIVFVAVVILFMLAENRKNSQPRPDGSSYLEIIEGVESDID